MNKKKFIVCSIVLLLLLILIVYLCIINSTKNTESKIEKNNTINNNQNLSVDIDQKNDSILNTEDSIESKNNENNNISDSELESTESNNEIYETQVQVESKPTIVVETPKQNNIWDELGISEYDYYNKPAHSWAKVDFKVSDYGNYEATLDACKKYGDEYTNEYGGRYFCYSINSYSNDYLGEMIEFS